MIKGATFAIFAAMALCCGSPAADSSLAATLAHMDEATAKFKGLEADMQKIAHTAVISEDSVDAGTIAVKRPNPHDIRVLFDISLTYKPGGLGVLSSYSPKPPTITVYENRLRLFREKLPQKDKPGRIFLSNLTNICVTHEIYHHIERQTFCFMNLACKVPIVDFKLFRIEKSMTMLSEIAAHAFAMKLLDLPHLPCIIQEEYRGG